MKNNRQSLGNEHRGRTDWLKKLIMKSAFLFERNIEWLSEPLLFDAVVVVVVSFK